MTRAQPTIRCVAVKSGRIVALGGDREGVARGAPAGSEVLHFPDGCVLPGFWDTHVHVASLGAAAAGCWLYDAASIEEIVRRLAEHARRDLEAEAVVGRSGNLEPAALAEGRLPAAADLDRAEADRPVIVSDVNKCVGNSAALAAAGLTAETPDPDGGQIQRDRDGRPTGVVWFGAKALLEGLIPPARPEDFADRFTAGLDLLAARGITTAVEASASIEQIETIRRLDAEGRLPCRVIAQPAAQSEDQLRDLEASRLEFAQELGPTTRVGPAKIFYDRFVMHRSARMSRPYEGQPQNFGGYFLPPQGLARRLRAVMDRGFPAAVHVTGDRGAAEAVEAFAGELRRRGSTAPAGSFLIHAYFPPPGLPERMAQLGISLAAQPAFLHAWADTLERFVGRERAEDFYPLDQYLAAGVAVAAGSDAPIVDPNPLLGLYAMTTRRSASGRAWGPQHALPAAQALSLYTDRAAGLFSWASLSGRLTVGEPADFVVLDRDPAATDAGDLRTLQLLATYVAGRETFRRPAP